MRIFVSLILIGTLSSLTLSTTAYAQQETSWDALLEVEYEEVDTPDGMRWLPKFSPKIQSLDKQSVRISGYMIPLGFEEEQTHFLISALPGDGCYFHLPGGPAQVIEVKSEKGIAFTYDTIEIEGTFEILKDDLYGLLYRMEDIKPVR